MMNNNVLNPNEAMILTTRSDFRAKMVLTISSFPSTSIPKQQKIGTKVLLYNSYSDEFYAVAKLGPISKLTANEKSTLAINYPNAYNSSWKYDIKLDKVTIIKKKFSLEEFNKYADKKTRPYGYTLKNKGMIMYIDNYDLPVFERVFSI